MQDEQNNIGSAWFSTVKFMDLIAITNRDQLWWRSGFLLEQKLGEKTRTLKRNFTHFLVTTNAKTFYQERNPSHEFPNSG